MREGENMEENCTTMPFDFYLYNMPISYSSCKDGDSCNKITSGVPSIKSISTLLDANAGLKLFLGYRRKY